MTLTDFYPRLGPPTADEASAWVAAALAEAAALRRYDDRQFPRDAEAVPIAKSIYEAWSQWLGEAQALRMHLRACELGAADVERFEEFEYAVDRTRAIQQILPENYLRNLQQALRGEGVSMAEARAYVVRRRKAMEEAGQL